MSNLIKKSWTVSNLAMYLEVRCCFGWETRVIIKTTTHPKNALFWPYVGQSDDHRGWATSIYPIHPRTNPWNFFGKILWIGGFGKLSFFESASSSWKSVNIYRVARMGRNVDYYPSFQPKTTPAWSNLILHICNNLTRRPRHISYFIIIYYVYFYIPGPSLKDSLQKPQVAVSGSNILLTCVVRDLGNHTLLWKYGVSKVLTAGTVRITSDSRYSVLHDKGKFLHWP